ncbi:unnamed protein product [Urochloa humidicola]
MHTTEALIVFEDCLFGEIYLDGVGLKSGYSLLKVVFGPWHIMVWHEHEDALKALEKLVYHKVYAEAFP